MSDEVTPPGKKSSDEIETLQHKAEEFETLEHTPTPVSFGVQGSVPELVPDTLVGPYHLIKRLGRGGFGEVWEAESTLTGRHVALKVLTAMRSLNPQVVERFKQEGKLAASLNHPHCVYIFGAEEVNGYPVISMELMRGGTLQDRLDREGPLEVKDAVDAILQVLDGLEAAHRAGILHRDIKPSNCFLDDQGQTKIGDFGLSKTLEADKSLTETGTFLGTPSYSSPEQVKGRDVDSRSDLYSLGATLYALLTGKPPFGGKNAGEVLARILSEPPAPFSEHRIVVPKGLQSLIFKLLAKDREKRFRSASDLRAALLPYSTRGTLTAAELGKRYIAYFLDMAIFFPLPWLFLLLPISPYVGMVVTLAALLAYFVATEGVWGRSLGKQVFGLRVVTATGAPARLSQIVLRTFVFLAITNIFSFLQNSDSSESPVAELVRLASVLTFLTMRKRNGYAGPHELISGTRVVAVSREEPLILPRMDTALAPVQMQAGLSLGPYVCHGEIFRNASYVLLQGRDDVLGRSVWIRQWNREASPSPKPDRPGRLRWLMSSYQQGNAWDAYEAPAGVPLSLVKPGWGAIKSILRDTCRELYASNQNHDLPETISLSQIWVDSFGHARIVDFPCDRSSDQAKQFHVESEWPDLLRAILNSAFTGSTVGTAESPGTPIPEHVRPLLKRVYGLTHTDLQSLSALIRDLDSLPQRRTKVGRLQRCLPGILSAVMYVVIPFAVYAILSVLASSTWLERVVVIDECHKQYKALEGKNDSASAGRRLALLKIVSYHYVRIKEIPQYKSSPTDKTVSAFIAVAEKEYPAVTEADYAAAVKLTGVELKKPGKPDSLWQSFSSLGRNGALPAAGGLIAIAVSFVTRGGMFVSLCGMCVQTTRGRIAGRFRCLLRTLIVWAPALAWLAVVYYGRYQLAFALLLFGILLVVMVSTVLRPDGAIQDRLSGTVLVPR